MELYRGMSHLEWQEWNEERVIPKGKNFTTCSDEALRLGDQNTLNGELIIVRTKYDDLSFQKTLGTSSTGIGSEWYETDRNIGLEEFVIEKLNDNF
ncbi:hypothetical protein HOA91_06360 [Candidatus Woesearchaeota archaeon]|jgi:hypothetical protein|nr:hypothetical protein [Candidatus Woesearchaeota archaeon]